jgi:hypothetical protein
MPHHGVVQPRAAAPGDVGEIPFQFNAFHCSWAKLHVLDLDYHSQAGYLALWLLVGLATH